MLTSHFVFFPVVLNLAASSIADLQLLLGQFAAGSEVVEMKMSASKYETRVFSGVGEEFLPPV